jgi:hypothetical protein
MLELQNASNSEIQTGYYYVGTQNYKGSSSQGTDVKSGWNSTNWSPQESILSETDGYGSIVLDVARPFVSGRTTSMNIRYGTYDGGNFRQVDSYCQERGTDTNAGIRWLRSLNLMLNMKEYKKEVQLEEDQIQVL